MRNRFLVSVVCLVLVLGGCARGAGQSAGGDGYLQAHINDPIEPVNRAIFGFNQIVDRAILEPTSMVYRAILPKVVRTAIHNFLNNLRSPVIVANQLLQGDVSGTGESLGRFVINTTLGVAGLFDVADHYGLEYEDEDFGQTLAVWGVDHGFYFVIPFIGPSSLRDGTGLVADSFADPVRLWAFNSDREWIYYTRVGLTAVDTRSRLLETVADLRRNSLDFYASVRSIYAQQRDAAVRDRGRDATVMMAVPDFDEEDDW